MSYSDLIRQEGEYTYSANIQFDIESDTKMLRFIPNEAMIKLMRDYFTDFVRPKSFNHARILYGSYGTGKSHFLTVLSQILEKSFIDGIAYKTFISRIRNLDKELANDIDLYVHDINRKPLLVVPIVFDFEDFNRCIYFSLKKKLDTVGIKVKFKAFFDQAGLLLSQWRNKPDSAKRLDEICTKEKINLDNLESMLGNFDPKSEALFEKLFDAMTYGVKYVYEVSNMADALQQATAAVGGIYSGIVFIFDEFGRYIEDNLKKIRVKSIQDIAECCDHCEGNNHILLVSHKEINQYTKYYGKVIADEWKKVEGRYKADSINSKEDQCLSLVRSILSKKQPVWDNFKLEHSLKLDKMYSEALHFKGFLLNASNKENPFESGFPLHPIALFALDRLSKKVAQNDRTFFTYLAGKDINSLYSFLVKHELDEFHFVGINDIFDYFEPSIRTVQSSESFEWYKNLQTALAKNKSDIYENTPEVKILKVITTIGIINDTGVLSADKDTLLSTIDCPENILEDALNALCRKKIIKYSGMYESYVFFDASIFDVEAMIEDESIHISEEAVTKTLNEYFVKFALYPYEYNHAYKITRVFIPVFSNFNDLAKKNLLSSVIKFYDGILVMLLGNWDLKEQDVINASKNIKRSIILVNNSSASLIASIKKFIAAKYIETRKNQYIEKDPTFIKELQYNLKEITSSIEKDIEDWVHFENEDVYVVCNGEIQKGISSLMQVAKLASKLMKDEFPYTLIVNNELINKNVISGSITTAKKNAVRAILEGKDSASYFGLQYLSPDYIVVRSVLAKNNFIDVSNCGTVNELPSGLHPQKFVQEYFKSVIDNASDGNVDFSVVYQTLKQPPYGLRNGYLSLLLACVLAPYRKSLIVSSHGSEQEISAELFENIVRRPNDFSFTVADWSTEQLAFVEHLEKYFSRYVDMNLLSKNRLKAIYDAILVHYKYTTKFARTTQVYVSDQTKNYRSILEGSYISYTDFFFKNLKALTGDYNSAFSTIKNCAEELNNSMTKLAKDLKINICEALEISILGSLAHVLSNKYKSEWAAKRQKSFDYYTNTFLEVVSNIDESESDKNVVEILAKAITGIELPYWSDQLVDVFNERLHDVREKLDSYISSNTLQDSETKMTLTTARGPEKIIVFNNSELSDLSIIVKNKINATLGNFGLAVTYEDKIQILLCVLKDLMEGKQ